MKRAIKYKHLKNQEQEQNDYIKAMFEIYGYQYKRSVDYTLRRFNLAVLSFKMALIMYL